MIKNHITSNSVYDDGNESKLTEMYAFKAFFVSDIEIFRYKNQRYFPYTRY